MQIKPSELILQDGKIYHLGLRPENLGDIIITVGDMDRVERVSRHFDQVDYQGRKREFLTHTGMLGKHRISVIGTGIGPDNIDILINELDALKNIDFASRQIKKELTSLRIVRLGTSGSIQSDIPVDSFVCSTHGLGLDGVLNFYQYEKEPFQQSFLDGLSKAIPSLRTICEPYLFGGDEELLHVLSPEGSFKGITITSGGFYAPQGRKLRADNRMTELLPNLEQFEFQKHRLVNFEMETAAIYGLCRLLGHKALSVNAIIANRANGTFSRNAYQTIDKMIETILEKLTGL